MASRMAAMVRRHASAWVILVPAFMLTIVSACTSLDCPLNNMVYTSYIIYNTDGERDTLRDTLTVTTMSVAGEEVTLLNRDVDIDSFALAISYTQDVDVLYFVFTDSTGVESRDTVSVSKENTEHFESTDCTPSYFHTITDVSHTSHVIRSIEIKNPSVTYDIYTSHFRIYLDADF